jgi:diguanylate cyclase (GGDEF)-like protein/PAS domain S-box-containing protein
MCALAAVLLTGLPDVFKSALVDLRFKWFPRDASGEIVVVAIDAPSIDQIGVWPWPRTIHADLIDRLERAGASDIAFDVDFSTPSNPESDRAFAAALQKAGGSIILPSFSQTVNGKPGAALHRNRPLPQFAGHAWPAIVNISAEPNGVVRRYPHGEMFGDAFLPSMAAVLAGSYDRNSPPLWIDFSIRSHSIPIVSYADVLRGDPAVARQLKGSKAIVGGTAIELGDRFNVPNGQIVSGPILQALAAESILQHRELRPASILVSFGLPAALAILMLMLWRPCSAGVRIAVLLGSAIAIEAGAMTLQNAVPVVVDTSLLHIAVLGYLAAIALDEIDFRDFVGMIAEKRFQRIAMALGDGLVCSDRNGRITVWNPGAAAIFGYQPEELIGQPLDRVCANAARAMLELPPDALQAPGGQILEFEGRRKNGETFPLEACFSGWPGTDGFNYGIVLRDISVRKREAERVRYLAEHDPLTGLANRNTLQVYLSAKLFDAKTGRAELALLVVGLDKFRLINDMLGLSYGDQILRVVGDRLCTLAGSSDFVARLNGDEFAIVVSGLGAAERASLLSDRLRRGFNEAPLTVGGRQQAVRISIGIVANSAECANADELLGNAHLALSRAKLTRRERHIVFERGIREQLEARLRLEAELERAIDHSEFELFYQPQVALADRRLIGAEALIRWRHPERGLVPPAEFMPVANQSAISDRIATWVLETACRQGRRWQRLGHDVRIGVNLSPSQLEAGDLIASVQQALADTGCTPSLLELEVTEDILLVDDEKALEIFRQLQDLGVRIVLDDFGTGYASLNYLKKFPIDGLKIDRSFVMELQADSDDAAIVGSTISLSKLLGLSVIAEGIEDGAAADLLRAMGCEEGQGYFYGRPMPAEEFEQKFLSERARVSAPVAQATAAA